MRNLILAHFCIYVSNIPFIHASNLLSFVMWQICKGLRFFKEPLDFIAVTFALILGYNHCLIAFIIAFVCLFLLFLADDCWNYKLFSHLSDFVVRTLSLRQVCSGQGTFKKVFSICWLCVKITQFNWFVKIYFYFVTFILKFWLVSINFNLTFKAVVHH